MYPLTFTGHANSCRLKADINCDARTKSNLELIFAAVDAADDPAHPLMDSILHLIVRAKSVSSSASAGCWAIVACYCSACGIVVRD